MIRIHAGIVLGISYTITLLATSPVVMNIPHEQLRIVFSTDSKLIVTSSDCTATLRDTHTGSNLITFGIKDRISSASLNKDGTQLLTSSYSGIIQVFDTTTGLLKYSFQAQEPVFFSSFNLEGTQILTNSENSVAVWDCSTRKMTFELTGKLNTRATFNASGNLVLTKSTCYLEETRDPFSGELLKKDLLTDYRYIYCPPHNENFYISIKKDIFSQNTLLIIENLADTVKNRTLYFTKKIDTYCLNNDGTQLLTTSEGHCAELWDTGSGKLLHIFDHENKLTTICFNHDGKLLLTATNHSLFVWDLHTKKCTYSESIMPHSTVRFDPNNGRLLIRTDSIEEQAWEASSGKLIHSQIVPCSQLHSFESCFGGIIYPDGKHFFTTKLDPQTKQATIILSDLMSGAILHRMMIDGKDLTTIMFSPDATTLYSERTEDKASLWNVSTGTLLHSFEGPINLKAFSPDSTKILVGHIEPFAHPEILGWKGLCYRCRPLELWDTKSASHLQTLSADPQFIFSPDNSKIFTSGCHDYEGHNIKRMWTIF